MFKKESWSQEKVYVNGTRGERNSARVWVKKMFMWMLHEVWVINNKRVWIKKLFMWMLHEVGERNSSRVWVKKMFMNVTGSLSDE
jgi:hypothetical protein